jgi:hypothetical protein
MPILLTEHSVVSPQKLYNGLDLKLILSSKKGEFREYFIIQIKQKKKHLTWSRSISSRDSRKAVGNG